jgi:hypothetical protein
MAFGLGSAAANAVGMAGDQPVPIVVPALPPAGLGTAAAGLDPTIERSQAEWRDEQWRQQQAQPKRRARGVLYDPESPEAKQQDALNASIRAEQAKGTMGLGSVAAGQGPSALQSAMGERDGEIAMLQSALAEPVTYGRKANPLRPIVERDAQNFYGGGQLQLEPFIPPPPEAGEDEWSYMERVQQLQAEDEQRQIQEAQTLGDVRDIGKDGHLGMGEAQLQAAENVGAAELQQAERVAEVQRQTAEASRAATAEARAADVERRDFARMQRDAIDQAQAVQGDARERLQALPELDPNRTFKSMEGGALFWSILGSIAGGAIGHNEVPGMLMEIASRDLDAQKANAAQTFDAAAAADAGVAQQTGLYRDLLSAAGDEAAADAMFLQLQLEDAARELQAQLAETTVPKLRTELEQSLVGVQDQINAQERALQVQLATTPDSFLVQTGGMGPRSRKLAEKRLARKEEERFKLQMAGVEGEGKFAEKAYDRETKLMEKGAERDTKLAEKDKDREFEIKKATDAWGQVETLIKDYRSQMKGDYHGVGMPLTGNQNQRIATRNFKRSLKLLGTSGFTGATASEEQMEQINGLVDGDFWEWTDEAFDERLTGLENTASSQRRYLQGQIGSETKKLGTAELPTFVPDGGQ